MPSKVFERLSQTKKDNIINAALKEFSLLTYEKATITKICKNAKIPRVTFYTYFDSLDDIYFYLMDIFKENCYRGQPFENDPMIRFFLSLINSEKGIKEIYKVISNFDTKKKMANHIIISVCFQYKHNMITYEDMKNEIQLLTLEVSK